MKNWLILFLFLMAIKVITAMDLKQPDLDNQKDLIHELELLSLKRKNKEERDKLMVKFFLSGKKDIDKQAIRDGVLERIEIKDLKIGSEEANRKLKKLNKHNLSWYEFRKEAASLIYSGADPNFNRDEYCFILDEVVERQDYFFANFLLKAGCKPRTSTIMAAKSYEMAKLLMIYNADLPYYEAGRSPYMLCLDVLQQSSIILFFYLEKFKNENRLKELECPYTGETLLFKALEFNHIGNDDYDFKNKIRILLAFGINPYKKNFLGISAVERAYKFIKKDYARRPDKIIAGHNFLECVEEYNQIFRETLIEKTKEVLPLELQDYVYKFQAGEDTELFESKDS